MSIIHIFSWTGVNGSVGPAGLGVAYDNSNVGGNHYFAVVVPEPSGVVLSGLGLFALPASRRRRR